MGFSERSQKIHVGVFISKISDFHWLRREVGAMNMTKLLYINGTTVNFCAIPDK